MTPGTAWREGADNDRRAVSAPAGVGLHACLSPRLSKVPTDGHPMNALRRLHDLGQSLWLDNITRDLLTSGTLKRYIDELSVTGLTSNPTIFEQAIKDSSSLRRGDPQEARRGQIGRSAVLRTGHRGHHCGRRPVPPDLRSHVRRGRLGLAGGVPAARLRHPELRSTSPGELHARAGRPNLFIKIPGTREGLPAVEETIFAGVPVNVTLLFSREHYLAAAEAYLRGIERRIAAGLKPDVASVASLFVSRWDVAVAAKVPERLRNRLGIAIGKRAYKAYGDLIASPRYQRVLNAGARPQRLLMASTGTKDPTAPDILYVKGLAAPLTVNTMPEATLLAFADHGEVGAALSADGGDCEAVIAEHGEAGIDVDALATQLQDEGAKSFVKSWNGLLDQIALKSTALEKSS